MTFVDDAVLAKSGPELFKELLRVYNVAEVEDYFKGGQWKDDMMKTDIQLIYMHAREAGAGEPTPLDEVIVPDLPKATSPPILMQQGALLGVAAVRPGAPVLVKPGGAVAQPGGAAAPAASAASGAVAELRLIALFVAKWKLDPTKAKLLLARVAPTRRRLIIQAFKATPGVDPNLSLQQFVSKSEAGAAALGAASAAVAPRPATLPPRLQVPSVLPRPTATVFAGAKRPLSTPTLQPAAKRPTIAPKAVVRPVAVAGAVRPPVRALTPQGYRVAPKAVGVRGLLQQHY